MSQQKAGSSLLGVGVFMLTCALANGYIAYSVWGEKGVQRRVSRDTPTPAPHGALLTRPRASSHFSHGALLTGRDASCKGRGCPEAQLTREGLFLSPRQCWPVIGLHS